MPQCLIGLGSNLGDPQDQLVQALDKLQAATGLSVTAVSAWYRSKPAGGPPGQPLFLNGAVVAETQQSARELMRMLHEAEAAGGRRRQVRWEARLIDLDLLLYGDRIILEAGLRVPHPWMAFRPFVLSPAAEIAAEMRHPEIDWTVAQLAHHSATNPKILALEPCPDFVFDAVVAHLSDVPKLYPLRFSDVEPARFGGLPVERTIEFISARAAWFAEQLQQCPADATIVVAGWWDQPPSSRREEVSEQLELKLREASLQVQRQLNLPVPHVTVGLAGKVGRSMGSRSEVETLYNHLRRPQGGPFLVLTTHDLPQVIHDVSAIVSGFHSLVQRA